MAVNVARRKPAGKCDVKQLSGFPGSGRWSSRLGGRYGRASFGIKGLTGFGRIGSSLTRYIRVLTG
jgi:hypothetical protein